MAIVVVMMMVRTVLPHVSAILRTILFAATPGTTAPGMWPVRISTITPIAVAMMSGITKSDSATVMVALLKLLDGGAVEELLGLFWNLDRLVQTPVASMEVGVVGVVVAPQDRSPGCRRSLIGVKPGLGAEDEESGDREGDGRSRHLHSLFSGAFFLFSKDRFFLNESPL